jgi:hypothetical protein
MIPCDMLHHITKYEGFLMNGIIVWNLEVVKFLKISQCLGSYTR